MTFMNCVSTPRRGSNWSSGGVDPAICSLDFLSEVSRTGWGDRGVYVALEGLVSWDIIRESDNVAKCGSALPGCVICQWTET